MHALCKNTSHTQTHNGFFGARPMRTLVWDKRMNDKWKAKKVVIACVRCWCKWSRHIISYRTCEEIRWYIHSINGDALHEQKQGDSEGKRIILLNRKSKWDGNMFSAVIVFDNLREWTNNVYYACSSQCNNNLIYNIFHCIRLVWSFGSHNIGISVSSVQTSFTYRLHTMLIPPIPRI